MKKIKAWACKRDLLLLKDCPFGMIIYHSKELLEKDNDDRYLRGAGIVKILVEIQ